MTPVVRKPVRLLRTHPAWSLAAVAVLGAAVVLVSIFSTRSPSRSGVLGTSSIACVNDVSLDTAELSSAISAAGTASTVHIAAGICALDASLPIHKSIIVDGAGPLNTFIVQHARQNIFQITAPGVTVENMNLNVATYNPGIPPIQGNPVPSVLFSAQSHTSILNVTAEAGTGFGMRITGSNPCDTFPTTGTVVQNVSITSHGRGGFTSLDIDCTNGAQLSNITISGDYIALYKDENVTITSENYTADAKPCQAPVYITGVASNITIDHVTGGGPVIVKGLTSNIKITNGTVARGC